MPDPESRAAPPGQRRPERWLQSKIARKGLRPRFAAYIIIAIWALAIVVFGILEHLVDGETFHSVWLGMWWATQTVTTVGYGDVVPQAIAGRIIAVIMMVGGLSLIAVVTGAITSAFVYRVQEERRESGDDPVMVRLGEVSAQLEALRTEVAQLQGDDTPREP